MTSTPPRPRRSPPSYVPLVAVGALGALLAVAGGRLSAELAEREPGSRASTEHASPARAGYRTSPSSEPREVSGYASARRLDPPAAAALRAEEPAVPRAEPTTPAARADQPMAELVQRVTEEASAVLERTRAQIVERCRAEGNLPGSYRPSRFNFNITFDAEGREIARGVSGDRRFRPPPEVAKCVANLAPGSLRVSPPGTNVGVRVAMMFP